MFQGILAADRNVTAPGFGARYLAFLVAKSRMCEDNFYPALLLRTAVRRLQHHCVPIRAVVGSMRSAAPCTALSLIVTPLFEQSAARRSTGSTTVQYLQIPRRCVCARMVAALPCVAPDEKVFSLRYGISVPRSMATPGSCITPGLVQPTTKGTDFLMRTSSNLATGCTFS